MILNRGKGNVFKIKIDFSLQINISDFVLVKDKKGKIYNLYGVITHIRESGSNTKFVATCIGPVDGNWYRYNDAMVTPINDFQKKFMTLALLIFFSKKNRNRNNKNTN